MLFLHIFPRTIKRTCSAHHLSQAKKQERKSNQIVLKTSEKNNVAHDIISLTVEGQRESSEVGWRRSRESVVRVQSFGNLLSYCFDLLWVVVAWGMRKRERHIEEKTDSSDAFPREKKLCAWERQRDSSETFFRKKSVRSLQEKRHIQRPEVILLEDGNAAIKWLSSSSSYIIINCAAPAATTTNSIPSTSAYCSHQGNALQHKSLSTFVSTQHG